jgi:hypothetical protein
MIHDSELADDQLRAMIFQQIPRPILAQALEQVGNLVVHQTMSTIVSFKIAIAVCGAFCRPSSSTSVSVPTRRQARRRRRRRAGFTPR